MADFVRASHPVFGTRMIPSTWLTMYPGVWTVLDPDDPGPGPDPLSIYVRDVDLPAAMDAVAADLESAFSVRQRAASVAAVQQAIVDGDIEVGSSSLSAVDNGDGTMSLVVN